MKLVRKIMLPLLCFIPIKFIEVKQNTNYVSHNVYVFVHLKVSLSLHTRSPSQNKFFVTVSVKFSARSWKYDRSSLNIFVTYETEYFEMFLESFKEPQVRQCQIRVVRRRWNYLKPDALCHRWSGNSSVELGVICGRLFGFSPYESDWFVASVWFFM